MSALGLTLARHKKYIPFAASIIYRTLGKRLGNSADSVAFLLPLSIQYAVLHTKAVRRAGYKGNPLTQGVKLFEQILKQRSGMVLSQHEYDEVWKLVAYKDKKIRLAIPEMLSELASLKSHNVNVEEFPFILLSGERRSYNANQIYRDPAWRKVDAEGALRIHPEDARHLNVDAGGQLKCISAHGEIQVAIELDDGMRRGVVSLPHGYGMRFQNGEPIGPQLNLLISAEHCDPLSKTPYHKYVPIRLEKC
ncbi:anaerobic dehydrogenase [Acinetobacter baumannii]|nr:anaerobic dehydrogenase [Acinetobacter baumannii]